MILFGKAHTMGREILKESKGRPWEIKAEVELRILQKCKGGDLTGEMEKRKVSGARPPPTGSDFCLSGGCRPCSPRLTP